VACSSIKPAKIVIGVDDVVVAWATTSTTSGKLS
jgi:hypothetical protein